MKKIAICLSGELRYFNHELVKDGFNKFIQKHNPDIFISTWDHIGVSMNHGWINPEDVKNSLSIDYITEEIKKTYTNIKSIDIENYNDWFNNIDGDKKNIIYSNGYDSRTVNSYSQLYKIYKSNLLKIDYENKFEFKYDIVFRIRPDLLFVNDLDLTINDNTIYNINMPTMNIPNRVYDIYFYGDSNSMDIVSNSFNNMIDLISDNFNNGLCKRDATRLLWLQSFNNKLNIDTTKNIPCEIWRNNISYEQFCFGCRYPL